MGKTNKQESVLIINDTKKPLLLSVKGCIPTIIQPNHNFQITNPKAINLGVKIRKTETSTG